MAFDFYQFTLDGQLSYQLDDGEMGALVLRDYPWFSGTTGGSPPSGSLGWATAAYLVEAWSKLHPPSGIDLPPVFLGTGFDSFATLAGYTT
jgi:hypothetical protein